MMEDKKETVVEQDEKLHDDEAHAQKKEKKNKHKEQIDQLELEKEALTKVIESDKNTIKQLQNEDSLERFAREQYGHKKKNETVFIIETTKTPSKN
mgnify:CR=1 FL=1